jgi:hypothetical protein
LLAASFSLQANEAVSGFLFLILVPGKCPQLGHLSGFGTRISRVLPHFSQVVFGKIISFFMVFHLSLWLIYMVVLV